MPDIYWADLHNHNEIGYGKGSLDRSYQLARNTLDVYALSVHGYWPDPPQNDPKLVAYHVAGFDSVSAAFPRVVEAANRLYEPGRFVAFVSYEWHSCAWGDYVVIFPGDAGSLHRAATLEELQRFVRANDAIMIPHHVGYRSGWRGLDWTSIDPTLSPLVEVFSEHGNSFEREGPWPMLAHSTGGVTSSQTITERLKQGEHFGFTAGTDTHYGYPGSHGEGITGIYAHELTRSAIFNALKQRHTFAGTGDRIEIRVEADGALPGDVVPAAAPRKFAVRVDPLAPLDYVEVIKNGRRDKLWPMAGEEARSAQQEAVFMVRIEWGWGRMQSPDVAEWRIELGVDEGEILRAIPCMGGGEASIEKLDSITRVGNAVHVASVTSRRSPSPISGVVLEVKARPSARISAAVQASVATERGEVNFAASLEQLQTDDVWATVLPRFSSPRIRLGRAHIKDQLQFSTIYEDVAPGERDTYVFKARQMNSHTVWTSPYLFAPDRASEGAAAS